MYRGIDSDYKYISGCLENSKCVSVSKVGDKSDEVCDVIRVRGTDTNPISENNIVAMFQADHHIGLHLGDSFKNAGSETSIVHNAADNIPLQRSGEASV